MNAGQSDNSKVDVGQALPKLSRSNLEVLPPLVGQATPLIILSSISVFEDIKAVGDPNAHRTPKATDITLRTNDKNLSQDEESLQSMFNLMSSRSEAIGILNNIRANDLDPIKALTPPVFGDIGKSCHELTDIRRRRYSVDCTPFRPEKRGIQGLMQVESESLTIFRKEGDRIRREYTDKFVVRHPFWKRYESRSLAKDNTSTAGDFVLENSNASISDTAYQAITKTGAAGWLHDETVDMCFDLLERISKSEKYGIAFSNTTSARSLFVDGEQYIGALQLSDLPDYVDKHYRSPHWDNEMIEKFKNKEFLVFPINDGYISGLNKARHLQSQYIGELEVKPNGSHWSVMIVDCRTPDMRALYFDSMHNNTNQGFSPNMEVSRHILVGLRLLCQTKFDNAGKPDDILFYIDPNTPLQRDDNKSGRIEGGSACGPFIFLIVKELVQYIIECHEEGKQDQIGNLALPPNFAVELDWDSRHTREVIRKMIDRERRTREWLNKTTEWLDTWPQPGNSTGWQTWLRSRQLDLNYFWDPRLQSVELGPWFNDVAV
jgi:hypothetical protein